MVVSISRRWLNLVERWFAELTNKQLRRGLHRSVAHLKAAIREFIAAHHAKVTPFGWTKRADEITLSHKVEDRQGSKQPTLMTPNSTTMSRRVRPRLLRRPLIAAATARHDESPGMFLAGDGRRITGMTCPTRAHFDCFRGERLRASVFVVLAFEGWLCLFLADFAASFFQSSSRNSTSPIAKSRYS